MEPTPTHETRDTRVWYLHTAESTGGAAHVQRVEYRPGSPYPPTHHHPDQDEHFQIEQGSMRFVIAGRGYLVPAGGAIDIPRGTPHRARNASDRRPAVVRWETRPALRTTEFFTTLARLGDEPGLLDAALLAREYRDVFRPNGAAGLLVPIVSGLARLLGRTLPRPV